MWVSTFRNELLLSGCGGVTLGEQVGAPARPPDEQTGFVKRTDVPVNTAVPPLRPAAGDSAPTGTAQQFAGINKSLIVQSPEVWSEGKKDKV